MNKVERVKMVRAMEFIARQINDEEVFQEWLEDGVADGDIEYGDLEVKDEDLDDSWWNGFEYYADRENFGDILTTFLRIMAEAWKSGGLYCDGVVSDTINVKRRKDSI